MDSTSCARDDSLEAIKEKIRCGELTSEEMKRRLENAIDVELEKPPEEMDIAFIKSCTDLIYELNNASPYESKASQYREEWREYRTRNKKAGGFRRRAITIASVAASLLILFIVGDGVLYREWLTGDSSKDKQQYIVEGHEFDPGFVTVGGAVDTADEQSITTDSFEDVADFMGFAPSQPTWLPTGWSLMEYRCVRSYDFFRTTTVFQHPTNEYRIIYEVKVYSDTATVRDEIEQNSSGASYSINRHNVYLVDNYDMVTAVWLEGATSYMLFAQTKDDVLKIIQSIE